MIENQTLSKDVLRVKSQLHSEGNPVTPSVTMNGWIVRRGRKERLS